VPEISLPTVSASATVAALRKSQLTRAIAGRGVIVIALVIALALSHGNVLWLIAAVVSWIGVGRWVKSEPHTEDLHRKRQEAEGVLSQLRDRLQADTDPERFAQRLKILEGKRAQLLNLPAARERRMKELVNDREKHARHRFLEGFKIEQAKIPGIGPAKRSMLENYDIETAADILRHAILEVPGFGPALATRLEDWRRSVENRFRFNPNSGVEARDIQELDRKIAQERSTLEHMLLQGANELSQIRQEIAQRRETLLAQAASVAADFAQANADWRALSGRA
jgi:DNA-binding helix-hairpin-helix protein with protein kinase domain